MSIRTKEKTVQLFKSAKDGDFSTFVNLIRSETVDINAKNDEDWNALCIAAYNGEEEIVEFALLNGADKDIVVSEGKTVTMLAAQFSSKSMQRLLISHGVDISGVDAYGWNALFYAASTGNLDTVQYLVEEGLQVDSVASDGSTPLMFAAFDGHIEVVSYLLSAGGNLEQRDLTGGHSAMFYAVSGNKPEMVEHLAFLGADVNAEDDSGNTPLVWSVICEQVECCEVLLQNGADPTCQDFNDATALMLSDNLKITSLLLEYDCEINATDTSGKTALMHACGDSLADNVNLLLQADADVDILDCSGKTALFYAARCPECVRLLLTKQPKPTKDSSGQTALMFAAKFNNLDAMIALMNIYSIYDADLQQKTALHYAIASSSYEVVQFLLSEMTDLSHELKALMFFEAIECQKPELVKLFIEAGVDPNGLLEVHEPDDSVLLIHPLTFAISKKFFSVAAVLIDNGADPDSTDPKTNESALMQAAALDDVQLAELLIQRRADLNKQDISGKCALYIAATSGSIKVARRLVSKGVELNLTDIHGDTALMMAAYHNHAEITNLLLDYGADPNVSIKVGWRAVHFAAYSGSADALKLLISEESLNITDNKGLTPIMMAAFKGHLECVKLLAENRADLTVINSENKTCCDLAIEADNSKILELLIEYGAKLPRFPLHNAAFLGCINVALVLLLSCIFVNSRNDEQETPLMKACSGGKLKMVEFLLFHGADKYSKSSAGLTAIQIAAKNGYHNVVQVLIDAGTIRGLKKAQKYAKRQGFEETVTVLKSNDKRRGIFSCLFR